MTERVLVIAAHPDDEVLGCGGTMAMHTAAGDDVCIYIAAEGITSRDDARDPEQRVAELKELHHHSFTAAQHLGISEVHFGGFPDNRMDGVDLLDVTKSIESHVARWQPTIVYTQHPSDCNIDHTVVHRATLAACRPLPGTCIRSLRMYEVLSSSDYASRTVSSFSPDYFVTLSEQAVEAKINAMAAYSGELREWPHPRSLKAIHHQVGLRGCQCGVPAAEAFMTEWQRV